MCFGRTLLNLFGNVVQMVGSACSGRAAKPTPTGVEVLIEFLESRPCRGLSLEWTALTVIPPPLFEGLAEGGI